MICLMLGFFLSGCDSQASRTWDTKAVTSPPPNAQPAQLPGLPTSQRNSSKINAKPTDSLKDIPQATIPLTPSNQIDFGGTNPSQISQQELARLDLNLPPPKVLAPQNTGFGSSLTPEYNGTIKSLENYRALPDQLPPLQIAIFAPFSGSNAEAGAAIMRGAELALFTLGDKDLRLVPYDLGEAGEKSEVDRLRALTRQAIMEGSRVIIGPLLANSVEAMKPDIIPQQIPLLSFSNSSRAAGGGAFITGPLPSEQVKAILKAALADGRKHFALIAPDNAYGRLVGEAMSSLLPVLGGDLQSSIFYSMGNTDFFKLACSIGNFDERHNLLLEKRRTLERQKTPESAAELKKLQGKETLTPPPFDAIVLAINEPSQLFVLASQLSYCDVDLPDVRILGLQPWESVKGIARENALQGAWFPSTRDMENREFETYYKKMTGSQPDNYLTALAFDMTVVAGRAIRADFDEGKGKISQASLMNRIADANGFRGALGLFRLRNDGLAERSFGIIEISKNTFRTLTSAPIDFVK